MNVKSVLCLLRPRPPKSESAVTTGASDSEPMWRRVVRRGGRGGALIYPNRQHPLLHDRRVLPRFPTDLIDFCLWTHVHLESCTSVGPFLPSFWFTLALICLPEGRLPCRDAPSTFCSHTTFSLVSDQFPFVNDPLTFSSKPPFISRFECILFVPLITAPWTPGPGA